MRYGHFDDDHREYVITRPDTPLPWINYLGSDDYFGIISNTAGGYSFCARRPPAAPDPLPVQQRPLDLGGRYLYLRDDDDGDYWSPTWQPTQDDLDALRVPARPGLHDRSPPSAPGSASRLRYFVPLGETLEVWRVRLTNERPAPARAIAVRHRRVLPVGRAGRRHELPAQLLGRRGRGRGRRHLSHDRVPGAARPLRVLRLLGRVGRLRHVARRVPRTLPGLGPAPRRRTRRGVGLDRARLAADGRPPGPPRAGARRDARRHLRARVRGEPRATPSSIPRARGRSTSGAVRPVIARHLEPVAVEAAFAALREAWAERLGAFQVESGNEHTGPDGQHLERLPVHGHVQPVALCLAVRVRDRARHGLPRLEPGPARVRPHGARAGAASASSTSPRRSSRPAARITSTSR